MAVEISNGGLVPHATSHTDLLAKLKTFVLANGWTALEDTADKLVLQGSGSGSDEIIVAIQLYANGWRLNGYTGYVNGLTFSNQPGAIPSVCGAMALWNAGIQYWFVVNSRRIIVVAKVNTVYHACYLGWFLPYSTPGQYPYPLIVGGSYSAATYANAPAYNDVSNSTVNFWRHSINNYPLFYVRQNNLWRQLVNQQNTAPITSDNTQGLYPYCKDQSTNGGAIASMGSNTLNGRRLTVDGKDVLDPVTLVHRIDAVDKGFLGELDGVFSVTGNGHVAEDIVTYGGVDHLIVNNVYRGGIVDFAAIKLA